MQPTTRSKMFSEKLLHLKIEAGCPVGKFTEKKTHSLLRFFVTWLKCIKTSKIKLFKKLFINILFSSQRWRGITPAHATGKREIQIYLSLRYIKHN